MIFMMDEVSDKEVSITEKGEPMLTYCYDESASFSHFHPLYAPNGQVVTEGMAETGQQHLPGICFTFGTVNDDSGKPVELHRSGTILDRRTFKFSKTEELAKIVSKTIWEAANPVLTEICEVIVYPLQNDVRILDLKVVLRATFIPITFEGKIGLGYQAVEMEHRKAANASGKIGEAEVNGQKSEWGTLCGINADTATGVAILPHPANGQTLFLAEDGYKGFLFANTAPFTLNVNEKRELNYRLLIYLGDLFTFDVWNYYQSFLASDEVNLQV